MEEPPWARRSSRPVAETAYTDASGVTASGGVNVSSASPSSGENSQSPGRMRHIRRSRS
jgi:hypothetical protein